MQELPTYYLHPSALYVSKEPYLVNTILGSCVSVCLFDPVTQIGGINHYMLPLWNGQGLATPKFGNIAIEKLIQKMMTMGCQSSTLRAKIFGGGEVIETGFSSFNIGTRNVQLGIEMLDDYRIPIISSSVGGKLGRKLQFLTFTGEVRMRFVQKHPYSIKNYL